MESHKISISRYNNTKTESWVKHATSATLIQVATHDTIAERYLWAEDQAEVKQYVSEHRISTPEVARQRVKDVAEYLAAQAARWCADMWVACSMFIVARHLLVQRY